MSEGRLSYKQFDPRLHHWSASKKRVLVIGEMDENHIINGIMLLYKNWLNAIRDADTMEDVVELLKNPPSDDIHIRSLVYELERNLPSA